MNFDLEKFLKALMRTVALCFLLIPFSAFAFQLLTLFFTGQEIRFDLEKAGGLRLIVFSVLLFTFAGLIAKLATVPLRGYAEVPEQRSEKSSPVGADTKTS